MEPTTPPSSPQLSPTHDYLSLSNSPYPTAKLTLAPEEYWGCNRYGDVFPHLYNAVYVKGVLYINASWVPSNRLVPEFVEHMERGDKFEQWASWEGELSTHPDFIVAQGPINPCDDFWEMIWQRNIQQIVCLTNMVEDGKMKCDRYWPEEIKVASHHNLLKATTTHIEIMDKLTVTTLQLEREGQQRTLVHLHHTGWGDQGILEHNELERLIHTTDELYPKQGPICVHCSAGIGRAGTFVGAYALSKNPSQDPDLLLKAMRHCRPGLIANNAQKELFRSFSEKENQTSEQQ